MPNIRHIAEFEESIFGQKTIKTRCGKRVVSSNAVSPALPYQGNCPECLWDHHASLHGDAVIRAYAAGTPFSEGALMPTAKPLPNNLWEFSHHDTCRECGPDSSRSSERDELPVNLAGFCEYCWELTYCAVEGCNEHRHVCSKEGRCSMCELMGWIEDGDADECAKWAALYNADVTQTVRTPMGNVPRGVWDSAAGKTRTASVYGKVAA